MAEFITVHPALKPIELVELLLTVTMSTIVIDTTGAGKIDTIGLSVPPLVALDVWAMKRHRKGSEPT